MMDLYSKVRYVRNNHIGNYNWLGNLRWYARESENFGEYSFETIAAYEFQTHQECEARKMTLKLFDVKFDVSGSSDIEYGADYIKTKTFNIVMPFYEYGCILNGKAVIKAEAELTENCLLIFNEGCYVCIKSDSIKEAEDGFVVEGKTVAAFNISKEKAISDCDRIFDNSQQIIEKNRNFWNEYFNSCPTVQVEEDFDYFNEFSGNSYHFKKEDIHIRQLWHWWCVLMNVNEVEFNKAPLYMAPDKIEWKGSWSNDALQSMAALSLTNQSNIAKRLIVSYMKSSINSDGVFSWYTHSDGTGCYGTVGDVGRFSHGAPYWLHTVMYYIKNTGDKTILEEDAGGMTVYEKLKKFAKTLIDVRMNKEYNMIEWANLWETGWDDKGGCFFDDGSLDDWMAVVSKGTDEEIKEWYKNKQRPVLPIVEQIITLWSLNAGKDLGEIKEDNKFSEFCGKYYDLIKDSIYNNCWSDEDNFYHDIDVKNKVQSKVKNADIFYWLYFEENQDRREKIFEHILSKDEFNCCQLPMLSKDSKGFNEHGYWSGGHWSREMSMVGMGLCESGFYEKAREIIIRAIMVAEGNIITEVINPLTGKQSTGITKMACSIMNVLGFLHIENKVRW
ncbi:MAG: hypothetical protein J6C17_01390 [Clostridia bacterium]|nr:hypothetical protein [Clostridia bacterium]